MAFDLLAAPASSSADKRQFSLAGHVVSEERWHTGDEVAEACHLLMNWFAQGLLDEEITIMLITPPITPPATSQLRTPSTLWPTT